MAAAAADGAVAQLTWRVCYRFHPAAGHTDRTGHRPANECVSAGCAWLARCAQPGTGNRRLWVGGAAQSIRLAALSVSAANGFHRRAAKLYPRMAVAEFSCAGGAGLYL